MEMAERLCPVWVGYFLNCPLRKLGQNPRKLLATHVAEGMTVLDVGCAMGFFSLPLARMVGPTGKVICVDVQERMIKSLQKRAHKAGLADRVDTRVCADSSLGLDDLRGGIDFALAAAVVHEVPHGGKFFCELREVMKPTARLLLVEPKGHVSAEDFHKTVSIATQKGLAVTGNPVIFRSRAVLLAKMPGCD